MPKYSVSRSITIEKDADAVFDLVSDYSHWSTWSPWLCAEPDAKVTLSCDTNSIGSKYQWEGEIVGAGELEHLRLERGRLIEDEIRFFRPFKSTSKVAFEFEPAGPATRVTWKMDGALPWFMFWMKPMMEPFIGMDYDRGLKMLKEWIETGKIKTDTQIRGVQPVGPIKMSGVRRTCKLNEIAKYMEGDIHDAEQKLGQHSVEQVGCMAVYHNFNIKTQDMDMTSGFMVRELPDIVGINNWELGSVQALRVDHIGSYDHLGNGWYAANQFARNTKPKLKQSRDGAFEIYRNDSGQVAEEELITEIYLPLK